MLQMSFAGTLGADADTRAAGSSVVTEFRVAVSGYDRSKREKTTTWLKVNIWGERGKQIAGLTGKGGKVAGSGSFEVQEYTTRDGDKRTSYVVTCQDLTLQSFVERDEDEAEPPPRARTAKGKQQRTAVDRIADDIDDDDLPF